MAHGGKRPGAGRPKGQGKYGEPTECISIPQSLAREIKQFVTTRGFTLPVYSSRVQAGYAMPADDHIEDRVDLMSLLVQDPEHTSIIYATGDSMIDAGIHDGDPLLVNHRVQAKHGDIVVAAIDGQVTVKFLIVKQGKAVLKPANPAYFDIPVDPENGAVIWGVVKTSIRLHQH